MKRQIDSWYIITSIWACIKNIKFSIVSVRHIIQDANGSGFSTEAVL